MIKTLKWIYKLGQIHENRRIKMELVAYIDKQPTLQRKATDQDLKQFEFDKAVYNSVTYTIDRIIREREVHPKQMPVYRSILDEVNE
jgi:hypothetical protein